MWALSIVPIVSLKNGCTAESSAMREGIGSSERGDLMYLVYIGGDEKASNILRKYLHAVVSTCVLRPEEK